MKICLKRYSLLPLLLLVLLAVIFPPAAYSSDNFGRDFTKTQLPSSYQVRQQPQRQSTPTLSIQKPQNSPALNTPSLQQPQEIGSQLPAGTSQVSQITTLQRLTKPKITVPDYEEKYKKILQAMQEKAARKKKKLSETLLEEVDRYGIAINIILIILIMAYVVYKEKTKALPTDESTDEKEDSIWREKF